MSIGSIGFGLGAIVCLAMVVFMCAPMAIGMIRDRTRRRSAASTDTPRSADAVTDQITDRPPVPHLRSGGRS